VSAKKKKKKKTPEMTPEEYAVRWLTGQCEYATSEIQKFEKSFADCPYLAFEWAEKAIDAAAKLYVARLLIALIEREGLAPAVAKAYGEAMNGARWPLLATSEIANLSTRYRTAAWASAHSELSPLVSAGGAK